MKNLKSLLFAVFLFCSYGFISAQTIGVDSFYSPSLEREMSYKFVLPAGYDKSKEYPVCYLLHGMGAGADEWINNTALAEYAKEYSFVFIIPSTGDHWYVNSFKEPKDKYEDYMIKDLPEIAASKYSVDLNRQALIGYSMGGYGSLALGLRHPERYVLIASMSGSLDVPAQTNKRLEEYQRDWLILSLNRAFGPDTSAYRAEHDPFKLIAKNDAEDLPYIYLVTGIDESYTQRIDFHREFTDSLRAAKIKYEYHETPGNHDYNFWSRELLNILRRLKELID
jgi:S-formylglutathione hydrolase FrmB